MGDSASAFEIQLNSEYVLVSLKGSLENDSAKSFNERASEVFTSPPSHVIFDCSKLTGLNNNWIRSLMQVNQKLKDYNRQLRLVRLTTSMLNFLKGEGLTSSLKVCSTLPDALKELALSPNVIAEAAAVAKTLDVEFVNPFLSAAILVLETQASTKVKAGQIYRKEPKDKFTGDISGVIGLVSPAFTGSVVISFPAKTFLSVMSRMLGEEYTEITQEIQDGAGELTNIIFGSAKKELNERGFGIKTALPSVVTGEGHSILQVSKGPRVVVPFESDVGPFFVEICIASE